MRDNTEHESTNEIVCSYCGEEVLDNWEMEDEGEIECDVCHKEYNYSRNITVEYSTRK